MAIQEVKIKDFDSIWKIVSEFKEDKDIKRYRSNRLYRGLASTDFHLTTSLKRNCKDNSKLESVILRNFRKYSEMESLGQTNSLWKSMIIGQHHGLPTRLMDWTYSPLVALHFMTDMSFFKDLDKSDGIIWSIDIDEINSILPRAYQDKLNEKNANLFTVEMLDDMKLNLDQYDLDMKQNAMVLLEPMSIDQRIINQYSYFAIVPQKIEEVEKFLDAKTNNTIKYVISNSLKWKIRDLLDQLNICERTIYPGLDGISKWIARRYFVND